jgi:hypothetical protein
MKKALIRVMSAGGGLVAILVAGSAGWRKP